MKRIAIVFLSLVVMICGYVMNGRAESASAKLAEKYAEAELLMVEGDYAGAATAFEALSSYSDSSQMAMYCKAISAAEDLGLFDVAIEAFTKLGEFRDCQQMAEYYSGRKIEAMIDAVIGDFDKYSDEDLTNATDIVPLAEEKYAGLALFKDCASRLAGLADKKTKIVKELADREEAALQVIYDSAKGLESDGQYLEAIEVYQTIIDFKDSADRIEYCSTTYKADNYAEGEKKRSEKEWEEAVAAFTRADDYSDAGVQVLATRYAEGSDKKENGDYPGAAEAFVKAGEYLDAAEQANESWYLEGVERRENQEWDEAAIAFAKAGDYSDAAVQVSETRYQEASALEAEGDQEGAYRIFIGLGEYSDSFERANKPYYELGLAKRGANEWDGAIAAFKHAGQYSDAPDQILETYYKKGLDKLNSRDWDGAREAFSAAGNYLDSSVMIKETTYQEASALEESGDQEGAYEIFISLGEYSDSFERANKPYYELGCSCREAGEWDGAIAAFMHAGDYSDAKEQIPVTYYAEGEAKKEAKDWNGAAEAFRLAGEYLDAGEQVKLSLYQYADHLENEGDLDESYKVFIELGDHSDSHERAIKKQYEAAETAITEHRYVDALQSYRRAIGYEDAYEKAVRLEKKFQDLLGTINDHSSWHFSFITADGDAYTVYFGEWNSKADQAIWEDDPKASRWIDGSTTAGVIKTFFDESALLQDGSITGKVYKYYIETDWKSIKDYTQCIWFVFGIRSDGRLLYWAADEEDYPQIESLSELRDSIITQIDIYHDIALIILDEKGQAYTYDFFYWTSEEWEANGKRLKKLPYNDIVELANFDNECYALRSDGSIYRLNSARDGKAKTYNWESADSLGMTWEDILLQNQLLTGKTSAFDERIAHLVYCDHDLCIHADGTVALRSISSSHGMGDWNIFTLWNDQTELERIFEWEAPAVDDKTIYSEAMELIDEDPQGTYDMLSSIVRYPVARGSINSDKRLSKIRNTEFGKGKVLELGRKDGREPDSYTIVDQQKDRVLVVSDTVFEYTLDAVYEKVKWNETGLRQAVADQYGALFNDAEKELILPVMNGDMKDEYVFCPSVQEIKKYFPKPDTRKISSNGTGIEWISRSLGKKGMIQGFDADGDPVNIESAEGKTVYYRLAFWVDLDQLPFDMTKLSGSK